MENKHNRFLDAAQEPRKMLQPIEGFQKMPLVSLEEAVEPIVFCCPDIRRRAFIALNNCEKPVDNLNQNESAAIFLYTMEWEPTTECMYYVLNKTLREESRHKLRPWLLYLKLILTALYKLPCETNIVYRGVTLDLSESYEIGKRYVWWAFSSCTRSLSVLESDQFLGKHGTRTLFNIECRNGRNIRAHSYIAVEDEIILPPATQFEVKSKLNLSNGFYIIHLVQVEPPFVLIEDPLPLLISNLNVPVEDKKQFIISNYRNEVIEQFISKKLMSSSLVFINQNLNEHDISIIVQLGVIQKQSTLLELSENKINDEAAKHIGNVLQLKTSLTMLSLRETHLSDAGVHWIAEGLSTNNILMKLELSSNEITSKGAQLLAQSLHTNKKLQELHLHDNYIGEIGAQYFSQALLKNSTLLTLNLGKNQLTDNGITHIAKMMKRNANLQCLYISDNQVTDSGMHILMNALCENHGLRELRLTRSNITGRCMSFIENMFALNDTLLQLQLSSQSFTIQEQDRLQAIAKKKSGRRISFW